MQEINIGSLTSLVHCKQCGCANEIFVNQEKINCKACGKEINLKINFGINKREVKK